MPRKLAVTAVWLSLGLGLLTLLLAGCGGSSSSSTGPTSSGLRGGGGSSDATIQGQLVNRQTASGESVTVIVLRKALGIGLAEAADVPVKGVEVTLTRADGAKLTTTTDDLGNFTFTNVLPGTYTISVKDKALSNTLDPIIVGAGDVANITGSVTSADAVLLNPVTVTAEATDTTIILQNDAQVAHLLNIAKAAGLPSADPVLQLRQSGWGWGRIAKHFNVNPGVIGLGQGGVSEADIDTFRASHGQGNAGGHGNANSQGNDGPGNGKNNGKGKGNKKNQG
jgi:SdrD B-like domain